MADRRTKGGKEFVAVDGLLYVSRFGPDEDLNTVFQRRLEIGEKYERATLVSIAPARLAVGRVGATHTIHFQQLREIPSEVPEGFVDIESKVFSLNAKDVYLMSGRIETLAATTTLEFSGIVRAVGPGDIGDINGLRVGDRVVVLAPNYSTTVERVPAWSAHKLLSGEDFATVTSLPVAYVTALYSLYDRACLRAGESILIHSGAGAFGMAAISMAQQIGAVIYTTVGSQSKREYLIRELGVPDSHIFNSRDDKFVKAINLATQGRGVNVVINSLTGDLLHASWRCISAFGRFIEVGKRELVDAGKLDMHVFLRNTTFTAFDIGDLFHHVEKYYRGILAQKMKQVLQMYRQGHIKPPPIKVFDASKIGEAYRYFSLRERIGKVIESLENPAMQIQFAPAKYLTVFDHSKSYLLVGCLGGLGRSLCRWMVARGARNFVFIGRTGADKPQAQKLVRWLESTGAGATVIRGDISKADDVAAAVAACKTPIGGVVQGAMALRDSLFSRMTSEAWHTAIQPKLAGTWNLHNALEGRDLNMDFFLLLSSVNGSVGSATESNYCSANAFLDTFAHWRRTQGKAAVSVGLGMISELGYFHENPDIEAMLMRRGAQPLNEQEFLHVVDLALASGVGQIAGCGGFPTILGPGALHILTGLEIFGIRQLEIRGFEVSYSMASDPRTFILTAAYEIEKRARAIRMGDVRAQYQAFISAPWWNSVLRGAADLFKSEFDAPTLEAAVLRLVRRKFFNLVLVPLEKIDDRKPQANFGIDSLIAAEFRTWFWDAFDIDISFLDFLSSSKSLASLA